MTIDDHVLRSAPQRAMQRLQLDYPASGPWDSRSEAALKRLEAELRELQDRRKEAIANVESAAAGVLHAYETTRDSGMSGEVLARALIMHAEPIRDALAPFDSGVRVKAGG